MIPDLLAICMLIAKGLLATVSVCFLLSGCDDFFIDVCHAVLAIWRRFSKGRPTDRHVAGSRLDHKPEQPIAVMIPAWDESNVIRRMLETNLSRIKYKELHIFVGTYPNDTATQREVELVRERHPNVHRFVCPHDGPTKKADCLNWVYQGIRLFEKEHGIRFQIFVMNDSEDVIHPLCFKLFNFLIPALDMVQLPVIPLKVPWWHFTAGHYLDEFAETHAKDIKVRAHLTGAIPAAGVGCGFSRRALEVVASARQNELFSLDSLTEDYDLGLRLGSYGLRGEFVRVRNWHTSRHGGSRANSGCGDDVKAGRRQRTREYVGISEYFPSRFTAAVKQKARWIVGIAFQGWAGLGWRGNLATKYELFRDRKGVIANPAVALGYCVVLLFVGIWTLQWWDPDFYRFPPLVERGSWLWYVILVNTFFLLLRVFQRCRFVKDVYGWNQALLAIPRQVWGNIVNVAAVSRAFYLLSRSLATGQTIAWDKTGHRFPSEAALLNVRRHMGDILLGNRLITVAQLEAALERQQQRRRPLGAILQDTGLVVDDEIAHAVAEQEHLPYRLIDPYSVERDVLRQIPRVLAIRYSIFPLEVDSTRILCATARTIRHDVRTLLEGALLRHVDVCIAPESDIAFAIRRGYQRLTARRQLPLIGEQLVASGVLNRAQLQVALREQRRSYVRLGAFLEKLDFVSAQALEDILNRSEIGTIRLGEILVACRRITRAQLNAALTEQRARFRRLGKVLVDIGMVSADVLKLHLSKRREMVRSQALMKRHIKPSPVITLALSLLIIANLNLYAQSAAAGRGGTGEKAGFSEEFRRFRLYPRLDRAYRLINEHRLTEARRELESCLSIANDRIEIWVPYLDVLYRLKEYKTLVERSGEAGDLRGDSRLRRYHLMAELELHNLDGVLEDVRALGTRNTPAARDGLKEIATRFIDLARAAKRPDALVAFLDAAPHAALTAATIYQFANELRSLGTANEATAAYERVANAEDAGLLKLPAYQALAALALEQRRQPQAREFLLRAHDLRPREVSVIRSLADLAVEREDWGDTIHWYSQWIALNPSAPRDEQHRAEMVVGRAYFHRGEYHRAAQAFSAAARAKPHDFTALLAAAQAHQQGGEPEQAIAYLKEALKEAPSGDLNARVGILLSEMGQPEEALPYLERASVLGLPKELTSNLFAQLGYAYATLNQPKAAREAFARALPQSADQAPIHAALGYASLALDDVPAAIDRFESSLALHDDPHLRRDLALAYARNGNGDAAAKAVEHLRRMPDGNPLVDADLLKQLAGAAFQQGRFLDAAALFRQAAVPAHGNESAAALVLAAESLERAGALGEAVGILDELTMSSAASQDMRGTAAERAGYLRLRLGDSAQAAASFLLAIHAGHDDWRLRLQRAFALTSLKRWSEALEESVASLERHDSARGHMTAALCFEALNKPGMAVHHFVTSLESTGELNAADQKYILDELTRLYADEANYEAASRTAQRSLHISFVPETALHLAQLQRRIGRPGDARATLSAIDVRSLQPALHLSVLDEQVAVAFDLEDRPAAIQTLQDAIALESTDTRLYQLGIAFRHEGDLDRAVSSLQASLDAAPGNLRYREALGYTYLQAGRPKDAVDALTAVAQQESDNLQVQQDLADLLMRVGDQPRAVRALRRAIAQVAPTIGPDDDGSEQEEAIVRMKSTVARIGKMYEAAGYFGYHAFAAPSTAVNRGIAPLLLSQSVFEVARYLTGSQRGFSVIGRIMSGTDGETNDPGLAGTLSQLALGFRYKPFVTENLNFSAERVFQINRGSTSSWLLRALYGKEAGGDVAADARWHPYAMVYGDAARFVGRYGSMLVYGETRFGLSRRLNGSWLVRPHIVTVARDDLIGSGGAALQLGAGFGVTRYFNSSRPGQPSSLEMRLYGSGARIRGSGTEGVGDVSGLTLISILRF